MDYIMLEHYCVPNPAWAFRKQLLHPGLILAFGILGARQRHILEKGNQLYIIYTQNRVGLFENFIKIGWMRVMIAWNDQCRQTRIIEDLSEFGQVFFRLRVTRVIHQIPTTNDQIGAFIL